VNVRAGPAALVRQNRAVMARADLRPRLPALRLPLRVVHGDADLLAPTGCAHEVAAAVPHARLEIVERCGHLLTMERPQPVNRLLLDWLAGLPAA
jgi:pimeloyl-ACP methyl ester carboxylesterase